MQTPNVSTKRVEVDWDAHPGVHAEVTTWLKALEGENQARVSPMSFCRQHVCIVPITFPVFATQKSCRHTPLFSQLDIKSHLMNLRRAANGGLNWYEKTG